MTINDVWKYLKFTLRSFHVIEGVIPMIYLDYSATTPIHEEVLNTFIEINRKFWANPSSLHDFGMQAFALYERAKEQALMMLKASDHRIYFTSGATEANNMAIRGICRQYQNRGRHLITTKVEHSSVYNVFEAMMDEGFEVTFLDVDEKGLLDLATLERSIRKDTILVSVMMVNAEVGTIYPIKEIVQIVKKQNPQTFIHSDIVQAVGKIPVHLDDLGIDLASIAGHKIYGPKGIGALIVRNRVSLPPLLYGGAQQEGIRPGTMDLASIVSLSKAIRLAVEGVKAHGERVKALSDYLYKTLKHLPYLVFNSDPERSIPHVINFSVSGVKAETVVHALAQEGIYISSKTACSSKTNRPSRVLQAMGFDDHRASSSLRVSLSHLVTEDEIRTFVDVFKTTMERVLVK